MCNIRYIKTQLIIIILGNVASASTNNESFVYDESLNRTSETHEGGSETSSEGPDRDENERGIFNFIYLRFFFL